MDRKAPTAKVDMRPRESDLKDSWNGVRDAAPVNEIQYSFATPEREEAFITDQFPVESDLARYREYRKEWYRRAKEMDPGPAPLAVTCELVSTCNLGCTMCYTITEEFQSSVVGAKRMLPWPVVRSVIDECAELGVYSMLFSWRGESTMYRDRDEDGNIIRFADVLAYARGKGILEITSLTHGQLIDEETARAIVDAEPNWISFSVDGLAPSYNKIRTPPSKAGGSYDAFETVTGNIRRLVEMRDAAGKTRPRIRVNSVYPAIAGDPDAYREFMESIGVDWVTVNELLDFRAEDIPRDQVRDDWSCQYPFQRLTVSANGAVLPCTGAHNEEHNLVLGRYVGSPEKVVRGAGGTQQTVPLDEINICDAWALAKLEAIRDRHKSNTWHGIDPGCRHCRHAMKKHGVEWLPEGWDMDTMEWKDGLWRE